jgi:uncharacterized ParB-like nuclease family protein
VSGRRNQGQGSGGAAVEDNPEQPAASAPPDGAKEQPKGGVPDIRIGGKAPADLTPEEITAYLAQRRQEVAALQKTAKARGIATKPAKDTDIISKFDKLFNRYGYSLGMRRWAQSRVEKLEVELQQLLETLGEAWDPEKQEEAREAMAGGYRTAQRHTSFPSKVITKDVPEPPVDTVLGEVETEVQRFAGQTHVELTEGVLR